MITIPEAKDIQPLLSRIDEINERTKNHTKQIKELQKQIRELEK